MEREGCARERARRKKGRAGREALIAYYAPGTGGKEKKIGPENPPERGGSLNNQGAMQPTCKLRESPSPHGGEPDPYTVGICMTH